MMPFEQFPKVLFVCMVRSPYFWINSTLSHPYNLSFQTRQRDKENLLRSPVKLRNRQEFKNIIEVWNHYYQAYASHLASKNHVVYIRLEDLVRDTANTLETLDGYLERTPSVDVEYVIETVSGSPSKSHNSHGEEWEEENRQESIYRFFNNSDLAFINRQLDQELMKKFGYPVAWQSPEIR